MRTSNPSLRNKSLHVGNKVAHVELLREDETLVPRCVVTPTYGNRERSIQKRFNVLCQKRAKPKKYVTTTTFGKFMTQCRMRECDLHTFRLKRPRNKPYDAYQWKPSKGNIVCTSKQLKHLMETSLMV